MYNCGFFYHYQQVCPHLFVLKQTGTIYEPNFLSCGYLQVSGTGRLTGVEFPLLPSLLAVTEDEKVLIAGMTNEQTHIFQAALQEFQSFGDVDLFTFNENDTTNATVFFFN